MNPTPQFLAAIRLHREMLEQYGHDHPKTQAAMTLCMEHAPSELVDEFHQMAKDMGLLPQADGYTADGEPVYRLDSVARQLGVSQAEAERALHEMQATREALGLPSVTVDQASIHRLQ